MPVPHNLIAFGFLLAAIVCAICHYTGTLKQIVLLKPVLRKNDVVLDGIATQEVPAGESVAEEREVDTIYDTDFEPESYGTGEDWAAWEANSASNQAQ